MHLEHTDIIEAPLDAVYTMVRDELPKLAAYLPNIHKVQTLEYSQKGSQTEIVNRWYANAKVPALVEKFIKEELFSWKDTAVWKNDQHVVDYKIESFLGGDIYEAFGTNSFKELPGNKTEFKVTCTLIIHAEKVPGLPKLIARKITPVLEKMIEKMLEPNLTSLGKGLKTYFAEKAKS